MGNASGPTLLNSSSDEDGPEDHQTRTWLPPQVAGPSSVSGPPTRYYTVKKSFTFIQMRIFLLNGTSSKILVLFLTGNILQ